MTSDNVDPPIDPQQPGQPFPPYQPPAPGYPTPGHQTPAPGYQPSAQGYQPPAQPYPPMPAAGMPGAGFPGQVPSSFPGSGYPAPAGQLANWGTRALGGLIDYIAPAILVSILSMPFAPRSDAATGTVVGGGFMYTLIATVLPMAWAIYNSGYKQGTTGQTFGKQLAKTRLISEATGQPVGFAMAVVRQIAHFVDGVICGIGFLFPLWDVKKQTLADKIMKTVVIMDQPR
jgi:uncharacterized RDD family membrane protein YckC